MEVCKLAYFTVYFLEILIHLYHTGRIDDSVFCQIAKFKIKFVEDNIKDSIFSIPSRKEKNEIISILSECKRICRYLESESK